MRLGPLELSRQILGSTILGALGYETQEREKTKDTRERENECLLTRFSQQPAVGRLPRWSMSSWHQIDLIVINLFDLIVINLSWVGTDRWHCVSCQHHISKQWISKRSTSYLPAIYQLSWCQIDMIDIDNQTIVERTRPDRWLCDRGNSSSSMHFSTAVGE